MRRLLFGLLAAAWLAITPHAHASDTTTAICRTFGPYCSQALRVAMCESRLNVWARNGQYLGLFQMGSYARSRYGHSWTAYGQSVAAYRYFRASGYSWRPWTCRP